MASSTLLSELNPPTTNRFPMSYPHTNPLFLPTPITNTEFFHTSMITNHLTIRMSNHCQIMTKSTTWAIWILASTTSFSDGTYGLCPYSKFSSVDIIQASAYYHQTLQPTILTLSILHLITILIFILHICSISLPCSFPFCLPPPLIYLKELERFTLHLFPPN